MSDRLLIELGLACNNRCVFCAQRGLDGASHTDDARVRAALEQGRAAGDSSLAFVGGEPTLHDGLAGWIQLARTLGYDDVALQTNGRRLAYTAYVQELMAAGVSLFEVSLQGPEPAVHDYHTRVEGSFRHTVKGLLNLRDSGADVAVTTVVTRSNFRNLAALADLVGTLGAGAWQLSTVQPLGEAATDAARVVPAAEMITSAVSHAAERARNAGVAVVVTSDSDVEHQFVGMGRTCEPLPGAVAAV